MGFCEMTLKVKSAWLFNCLYWEKSHAHVTGLMNECDEPMSFTACVPRGSVAATRLGVGISQALLPVGRPDGVDGAVQLRAETCWCCCRTVTLWCFTRYGLYDYARRQKT